MNELRQNWQEDMRWQPAWMSGRRATGYAVWSKAVQRTLNWMEVE